MDSERKSEALIAAGPSWQQGGQGAWLQGGGGGWGGTSHALLNPTLLQTRGTQACSGNMFLSVETEPGLERLLET